MNEQNSKEVAEALLNIKQSIIPIQEGIKLPALKSWKEFQSRYATKEELDLWFENPNINIAMVTGKISGVTVVDIDLTGEEAFKKMSEFPETMTVKTRRGGYHLYYQYCPDVRQTVGILPHIDIRNDGGYVLLPPSKIVSNGSEPAGEYTFFRKIPYAKFPKELFKEIIKEKEVGEWKSAINGSTKGSRNDNATKVIGYWLSITEPENWETVWDFFTGWNLKNTPPLSEYELRNIFNSISSKEILRIKKEIGDDIEILKISEVANQTKVVENSTKTGLIPLDEMLGGGIQEGDLTIISGSTGNGKTFLSQCLTVNLAKQKISTLWFTYEMPVPQLWDKFKQMGCDDDFISYTPMKNFYDTEWLEKKVKESKLKFNTKVVFIDHLGFLTKPIKDTDKNTSQNYALYLTSICREIKKIAINNNISIFLLVHRTKDNSGNDNINDVAYSAGITQEADTVLMIRREIANEESQEELYTPYTFLKIVKNRKTGICKKIIMETVNGKLEQAKMYVPQLKTKTMKLKNYDYA